MTAAREGARQEEADMYYIGIDVGGTNLAAGLINQAGELLAARKRRVPAARRQEEFLRELYRLADETARDGGVSPKEVKGIGMGIPGTVDREKGIILYTCNLPLRNLPVKEYFQKSWDAEIYLGNDANCALLGEVRAGAAAGCRSAIVLTIGTGVGAGVLIGGKIYTGFNGGGVEVGHMVIESGGAPCACGRRGCWEAYASATGLKRLTREEMERCPESAMWTLSGGDLGAVGGRTAFEAARAGDPAAIRVRDRYLRYLGDGLVNLVNIFQPEVICLGGGVSNEEDESFLRPLAAMVERERYTRDVPQTRIVKAALGNMAGVLGAALLGRDGDGAPELPAE